MNSEKKVMDSRLSNRINVIFLILISISAIMSYSFYRVWNNPKLAMPRISSEKLEHFSIDLCSFEENTIRIKGWAFIQGDVDILNRIYAERNNGEMNQVMSSSQKRSDVSNAFDLPGKLDKAGFLATRHDTSAATDYSKKIMIVSIDKNGVGHAVTYQCK